jgi:hypothetical protein
VGQEGGISSFRKDTLESESERVGKMTTIMKREKINDVGENVFPEHAGISQQAVELTVFS